MSKYENRVLYAFFIVIILSFFNSSLAQVSTTGEKNDISSFVNLHKITVTIGGEFIVNGSFLSASTERLDQFITRVYNEYRTVMIGAARSAEAMKEFKMKYDKFALRDIELIRKDGSRKKIDLMKFRLTGDFEQNPFLTDGDLIIFPPLNLEENFISVDGAVNKPITFQYVEGDNLQTALFFARGINKVFSNVNKVEITRLKNNGYDFQTITASINDTIPIYAGDRIRVLYNELNSHNYNVLILGEVNNPGKIAISKDGTTLKEVINKAGGFTEFASLKFSELIRNFDSYNLIKKKALEEEYKKSNDMIDYEAQLAQIEFLEELKMYRNANLQIRDTIFFKIDNTLRMLDRSLHLDFRELKDDSSYVSNFIVEDGDLIIVPKKTKDVYVFGGVAQTGYYEYSDSLSVWDYIDKAGGYTEIAYGSDEVYLIKGKSRDWVVAEDYDNLKVEPGDFIYVKKERPTEEFWFYLGRVGAVAAILGSLATIILIFK